MILHLRGQLAVTGGAPTFRELARLVGCSLPNVLLIVQELVEDGILVVGRLKSGALISRSIRINDEGLPALLGDDYSKELAQPLAPVAIWRTGEPKGEPWNI